MDFSKCYNNLMLSLLYGLHFAISVTLLRNISEESPSVGHWALFILLILPFILSYLISMLIIIYDLCDIYNDRIEMNPLFPFELIYHIIIKQHHMIQIHTENSSEPTEFVSATKYILTMITWMFASLLGPILSIVGIWNHEIRDISIAYQLLSIIPSTIFHFCFINTYTFYSLSLFTICCVYIVTVVIEYKLNEIVILSILIECVLLFHAIFIAFLMDYDDTQNDTILSAIALIGFIILCFPNLPYYKSYLLYQYITWSQMSHVYQFIVIKTRHDDHNEMIDKLYAYLHQISHVGGRTCRTYNNVCFQKHDKYLKMNEECRWKYVRKSISEYMSNGFRVQNVIKIVYTVSWIAVYLYPVLWLSFYLGFNSETWLWNTNELNHQQLFLLVLFMTYFVLLGIFLGKIYETIRSIQRLRIMKMCYCVAPNAKRYINQTYHGKVEMVYDNLKLTHCLLNTFTNDIGFIILTYALRNCYEPNYLDGPKLAMTYDL
eukprot:18324_1